MQASREIIIDLVRALMPVGTLHMMSRTLTGTEARVVAERQAARLLKLLGIAKPPVEIELALELPDIGVEVEADMPLSARTDWDRDRQQWVVTMNQDDSLWRSRSTLGHEIKHILDDPFRELLYPEWPRESQATPPIHAERICDYFAGCALVPRTWLLQAWQHGTRDRIELASLFNVSDGLAQVRLKQVGLIPRDTDANLVHYTRRGYRHGSRLAQRVAGRLAISQMRTPQLTT